jgi:hypothetical protein
MSLPTITIKLVPETPVAPGYIPTINMPDPADRTKMFMAYPRFEEEGAGKTGMYFDLPQHVASVVLARDQHLYKLWAPATLVVPVSMGHGAIELVKMVSVDPNALREEKAVPALPPSTRRGRAPSLPPPPPEEDVTAVGEELENLLGRSEE